MSYVLFFKTEELTNKRYYYARICDTKKEALIEEAKLVNCGHNNQRIIYTVIKKGIK